MGKVKKFTTTTVRKITGGKDPRKLIEDFISQRGFSPEECLKEGEPDSVRWMVGLSDGEELEILLEGLKNTPETTVYMGVNVATVPVRGCNDLMAAALEVADGLVGIKLSLVGHFLVLSSTMSVFGLTPEELDYNFKLIAAQKSWFREALADELGWELVSDT